MRVADRTLSTGFLNSVNRSKEEIQKLQTQMFTQSKINRPSDDPSGMSRSLKLSEQVQSNETYKKNVETSLSFLQSTNTSLEAILKEIEKVEDVFVTINNPANKGTYSITGDQVSQSLKSIVSAANNEFEGKYVLGGTDFSTAPYGFTADESAVELKVTSVSGEHKVKISKNYLQKVNITGEEIFGDIDGTDVFNTLKQISDDLKAGTKPSDADMKIVKDFRTHLLSEMTSMGEIMTRLESTSEMLDNQTLELKSLLSKEKDVDATEAITELQNKQYFLEMSYKMSTMILQKSLLDFL